MTIDNEDICSKLLYWWSPIRMIRRQEMRDRIFFAEALGEVVTESNLNQMDGYRFSNIWISVKP